MALWLLIVMIAAAGCAPAPDLTPPAISPTPPELTPTAPDLSPPAIPPTQVQPTPMATTPSAVAPLRVRDPVRVAREALAEHVGVPVEEVEVVDWMTDTFPLDNLGCPSGPEEGVVRPAMVVGYEVTLRVGGETYEYHVYGRRAVLCRGPE